MSLAARREAGSGGNTGGHSMTAAFAALASAAEYVKAMAATGRNTFLAGAEVRLGEAVLAAENLAARKIEIAAITEAAYAAAAESLAARRTEPAPGAGCGRRNHLRPV